MQTNDPASSFQLFTTWNLCIDQTIQMSQHLPFDTSSLKYSPISVGRK